MAQAIPIGLAVAGYGLSYGVLAVAAGLSPRVATLSSVIVLAGGSQFAFVGVLAAGGNPMAGAVSGLLLNVRYLAFGLAIAPHLGGGRLWRRMTDAYLIVDESVAAALGATDGQQARRHRVIGVAVVIGWIGATALGAYGGQLLGDPQVWGLDAAFPAGFLALLAPWLRQRRGQIAAGVGAALALLLTPLAPPGVPIIAAGIGALVAMRLVPAPDATSGSKNAPEVRNTSATPDIGDAHDAPETPDASDAHDTPGPPEGPGVPGAPSDDRRRFPR